jgi:tetratricopeptide (TPR) repeat protein
MLLHFHVGDVVSREMMIEQCWDGRIVGDDVINRAISILRKLAERAGGFRIDTIPRAGYRLVEGENARRRRILWGVLVSLLGLIGIATWIISTRASREPELTVRVLPFVTDGGAEAAMVAGQTRRALSETLTGTGFAVLQRGEGDLTVSGDVAMRAGKSRVVTTVDWGSDRRPMMSTTVERPITEASNLPEEVAADLAETLTLVSKFLMVDGAKVDDDFAGLIFAAFQAAKKSDYVRALELVERLNRANPQSPAAQALLAGIYAATLESYSVPERKERVRVARGLLSRNDVAGIGVDGHVWCLLRPRSWLAQCEARLRDSAQRAHYGDSAPERLAELVADVGRLEEALRLARIAYSQDQYYSPNAGTLIQLLEIDGRHREAEAVYADAIQRWPNSWQLRWNRIMGLSARGEFAALERFASTISKSDFTFDAEVLQSALAAYRHGDRPTLRKSCATAKLRASTRQTCVALLSAAGELDASFEMARDLFHNQVGATPAEEERMWLQRPAYFTISFLSAPAGAPLRRDPRFVELARQTGLLRYWRTGRWPDFCTGPKIEPVCSRLKGG